MIRPADILAAGIGRLLRKRMVRRGQILVLGVVIFFLFFLVATVLVDVYTLFEARNWGYRVAQQAALAGAAGTSTKWVIYQPTATVDPSTDTPTPGAPGCINPVWIELLSSEAYDAAEAALFQEMGARGYSFPGGYEYDIRVLPDHDGGTVANYPTIGVRLGESRGDWSADNPAVGVYISFHVDTFLLSAVGIAPGDIHVFASAEAAQPPVCP
jgi:hypothetical protein